MTELEADVAPALVTEISTSSKSLSEDIIKDQSKIYGRNTKVNVKLSRWQDAVNDAAFNMVKKSPDKMYDRSLLKFLADEEARKTYVFQKKSGSRSNYVDHRMKKREKLSADNRDEAIKLCSVNLKPLTEQCENKHKQITQASRLKNYE